MLLGPAYGLFKEATIFTFVLGIVLIMQAFEAMPFLEGQQMEDFSIGIAMFTILFFILLGLMLIGRARDQIRVWRDYESQALDYRKLENKKKEYEDIQQRNEDKENGKKRTMLREEMGYYCTRLHFIFPIYLPTLKESFLRKDFNFAYYLALAQAKTLEDFFNISSPTVLIVLILAFGAKVAEIKTVSTTSTAIFLFVLFILYFMYMRYTSGIVR